MTVLLAGSRPIAAHPAFTEMLLAQLEVERLEDLVEQTAAALLHAVPVWRIARGSQRIVNRRQAATAIRAVKMSQGALAQARRALADARRAAQGVLA